jgi:hypothetical protein
MSYQESQQPVFPASIWQARTVGCAGRKPLNIIAGAAAEGRVDSASTAALSALLYIMLIIGVKYRRSEVGA